MNRYAIAVVFVIAVALAPSFGQTAHSSPETTNGSTKNTVVLPNPGLLTCSGAGCSRLWLDDHAAAKSVYPKQLIMDISDGSASGIMATYDKSTSIDDVRAAIVQRYGKWVLHGGDHALKDIWRVEPEKFAFALDKTNEGPRIFCFAIR